MLKFLVEPQREQIHAKGTNPTLHYVTIDA